MGMNRLDVPFYKPPETGVPFTEPLPVGQIILFKDDDWTSESLTIDTALGGYPEGYPFSFSGTDLQDHVTWIAFNLPVGTVCTLFKNTLNLATAGTPGFNPAGGGVSVDLIGNGETQTVDLVAYGANDMLSGGIWRQVDYDDGWFQLFHDGDQQGEFITVFFSEWPINTPVSLAGWDIDGQASSVNYMSLTPPQVVVLTNQADGTGYPLALGAANAFQSVAIQSTVDMTDRGFNDQVHSFTFTIIEPVKAFIDPVSITPTLNMDTGPANVISETIIGTNYSSEPVVISTNVFENVITTLTTTTTLQYTNTEQVTVSAQVTAGFKVTSLASLSAQVTVTNQFTTTTQSTSTKTVTTAQELQLGQTITFTAPPSSTPVDNSSGTTPKGAAYSATATISVGTIQVPNPTNSKDPPVMEQVGTTMGHFYYRQNLPGSILDPANSGLFILDMPITIALAGSIGTQVTFDVDDISDATAALIMKKSSIAALQPDASDTAAQQPVHAARSHRRRKVAQKA
jgi:hypothetical protein